MRVFVEKKENFFKCSDISKSKIFWLVVILLVLTICGLASALIVILVLEKKTINDVSIQA